MLFVYKNRFLARQIGPVMAFIPDVHLLEDNDPIKKQRWLLSAGFFSLADFPQKQQECFSEDHYWFISGHRFCRQRKVKTFSSCAAHFRSGNNIFFCSNCNDNSVHHSKDAFV